MAGKRTSSKIQKVQRSLSFLLTSPTEFLDSAQALSMVNRKLFRQNRVYGVESVEFSYAADPALIDTVTLTARTAGDTWVVHNAHVKAEALYQEMNQLVLADNPSIQGKWHDFKVYLNGVHFGQNNTLPRDGDAITYTTGAEYEWNYSDYVMPQHDVDPATGLPELADQTKAHLLGDDVGVIGAFDSVGLIKAYADSRATVFPFSPNVPGAMSTSFFNLLTDSGSQEPELADVIEADGDMPPYALNAYPGGDLNAPVAVVSEFGTASVGFPLGMLSPFIAQCGLIQFDTIATKDGVQVAAPPLTVRVTYLSGKYKGVASIPMGQ